MKTMAAQENMLNVSALNAIQTQNIAKLNIEKTIKCYNFCLNLYYFQYIILGYF